MKAQKTMIAATACFAALLMVSCKIDKDANCLNPKASCYKKDTEAPRIVNTTPTSQPTTASPTTVSSRTDITLYFSEPMKNAGELTSYKQPTGAGNTLQITGVTKVDEQTYRLNLGSGNVGLGTVTFDVSALTDLAGNSISPGYFALQTGLVGASPAFVSATGFTSTTVTWSNPTPDAMNYTVKKGIDCSGATLTGTNVSGSVSPNQQIQTILAFGQIAAASTESVRICLTPASTGTATDFATSVTRDEIVPTLSTLASGTYARPHTFTVTCTDVNVDKVAYTTNGSVPTFSTTTGDITNGTIYSSGYALPIGSSQFRYACIDRAGNVSTPSANYSFVSGLTWDTGLWFGGAPNDVWM